MEKKLKRLFLAMELDSPWPEKYPPGKVLESENRHLTLAFLGMHEPAELLNVLQSFPKPDFSLGLVGKFIDCIFLPPFNPRVAAWEIKWLRDEELFNAYQKEILTWLESHKIDFAKGKKERKFLPHVTIARQPMLLKEWQKVFTPLPVVAKGVHLFESEGNSQYKSLWGFPLTPPFQEIEHTADIGYKIRGKDIKELFLHAQIAIAFEFPIFINYLSDSVVTNLDEVIVELNNVVTKVDSAIGSPIKAVSYHGEIKNVHDFLEWEMIIDV